MTPVIYTWTGSTMVPLPRFDETCAEQFTIGDRYRLVEFDEASAATRGHYFAALHEAWLNLPHDIASEFENENHFRKWCLIRCGFYRERKIVCIDADAALQAASDIENDYDFVVVRQNIVVIRTAESQRSRVMGAKRFQASKQAVLDYAASLIGVSPEKLTTEAGKAA